MESMEIYFHDLNTEAQKEFEKTFGSAKDQNLDIMPIAIIDREE